MACNSGPTREQSLQTDLDRITRYLCGLCGRVPADYILADPDLGVWWAKHQQLDARRKVEEEAEAERKLAKEEANKQCDFDREFALGKLTPAERKLLGLK